MAALISVIVPVYNTAPYLEACVRSVLKQTYPNIELILMDDGSDDGSGELCERLGETDQRVRVLHQAHGGVSAARNKAMQAAQGEYLFFLDSDDGIHPELLQTLYSLAEKTGAVMAASDFVKTEEQAPFPEGEREGETGYSYLNSQEAIRSFYFSLHGLILSMIGGKLLRRSAVGALKFDPSMGNSEDTKFVYQLLERGGDAVICFRKWYYYRWRAQSATKQKTSKSLYDRYRGYQYISASELEKGRTGNAAKTEQYAVEWLDIGYCLSRREGDCEMSAFWKALARNEEKSQRFSTLSLRDKAKFYLVFYSYPLYRFLYWIVHGLRRGKKVCAVWMKKVLARILDRKS